MQEEIESFLESIQMHEQEQEDEHERKSAAPKRKAAGGRDHQPQAKVQKASPAAGETCPWCHQKHCRVLCTCFR